VSATESVCVSLFHFCDWWRWILILHDRNSWWYLARGHDQFHTAVELKEKEPRLIVSLSLSLFMHRWPWEHTLTLEYLILLFKKYIKFPFHRQISRSRRNDLAVNCLVVLCFFPIHSVRNHLMKDHWAKNWRTQLPFQKKKKEKALISTDFFFYVRHFSWPLRLSLDAWEEREI
jgi:hypothetical protein